MLNKWVVCTSGFGHVSAGEEQEKELASFPENSMGAVIKRDSKNVLVYLPGQKQILTVEERSVDYVDIFNTGTGYDHKICNICFVLKPIDSFSVNSRNSDGEPVRRPSCQGCREIIEGKPISIRDRNAAKRTRPSNGTLWQCPICYKQGIVGVTVQIVIDHNRSTGHTREYICDSCNTGLGRFKDDEKILRNAIAYLREHEAKS